MLYFTHSFNKEKYFFFSHFIWYQSRGRFELGFCHVPNSGKPPNGCVSFRPPHLCPKKLQNPSVAVRLLHCRKKFSSELFRQLLHIRSTNPMVGSPDLHTIKNLNNNQSLTSLHAYVFLSTAAITCWLVGGASPTLRRPPSSS